MDIAISELRANLRTYLDRVRHGDTIVVTERGVPVARLSTVAAADPLERLTQEGVISRPAEQRPRAGGRKRVRSDGSVSELISELRR